MRRLPFFAAGLFTGGIGGALGFKAFTEYNDTQPARGARGELKYGVPKTHSDSLLVREGYSLCFDQRTRNPLWTAELLTKENLKVQ